MIQIEDISDIKKHIADLQAIIFDLDDTLYPLNDYVQSGFRQISRLFLGHSQEVYDQLWNAYEEPDAVDAEGVDKETAGEDFADAAFVDVDLTVAGAIHAMLQAQGLDSDEMEEKCLRIYEQHRPSIQPYDGVVELLQELREKGIRLGLIIDGPAEMQREKLRALGIIPLFDEIIITDDIAGHGDVMKFRTSNPICFEIMRLRLNVPDEKIGYVSQALKRNDEMKSEQKYEILYKLWEHHSNLLWNKVQNVLVMMAAFYTAWFLLLNNMNKTGNRNDWIYLIMIAAMCFLVVEMCFCFKNLIRRDVEQQYYVEEHMPEIFKGMKGADGPKNKKRGRVISQRMMDLCISSCIFLFLISVFCFYVNRWG